MQMAKNAQKNVDAYNVLIPKIQIKIKMHKNKIMSRRQRKKYIITNITARTINKISHLFSELIHIFTKTLRCHFII